VSLDLPVVFGNALEFESHTRFGHEAEYAASAGQASRFGCPIQPDLYQTGGNSPRRPADSKPNRPFARIEIKRLFIGGSWSR
jgi:hypothetical protein